MGRGKKRRSSGHSASPLPSAPIGGWVSDPEAVAFERGEFIKATNALSADGDCLVFLAYVPPTNTRALFVKERGAPARELCSGLRPKESHGSISLAPGAGFVAFTNEKEQRSATVTKTDELLCFPTAGGPGLVIASDIDVWGWTANGQGIVYASEDALHYRAMAEKESRVISASGQRVVRKITAPVCAPDGDTVIYVAADDDDANFGLFAVSLTTGMSRRLSTGRALSSIALSLVMVRRRSSLVPLTPTQGTECKPSGPCRSLVASRLFSASRLGWSVVSSRRLAR